jgi:hypothetical protein
MNMIQREVTDPCTIDNQRRFRKNKNIQKINNFQSSCLTDTNKSSKENPLRTMHIINAYYRVQHYLEVQRKALQVHHTTLIAFWYEPQSAVQLCSTISRTLRLYSRLFSLNMRAASEFAGEFGFGSQSRDWQKNRRIFC